MTFRTDAIFRAVFCEDDSVYWNFSFSDNIDVYTDTIWRIFENNILQFISEDHGQQFGLPAPKNLINEVGSYLLGKKLNEINTNENGDLKLIIEHNIIVEFLITSMGYESYSLNVNNERYIGMGGGAIHKI